MKERFARDYGRGLETHVTGGGEASLTTAYELGREAVGVGLGILELSALHNQALLAVLGDDSLDPESVIREAGAFLAEALSAYEMVRRGVREVREMAVLEKRHSAELRRLADASIALGSTLELEELLGVIAEEARRVVGARCIHLLLRPEGGASDLLTRSIACPRCQAYLDAIDPGVLWKRSRSLRRPGLVTEESLGGEGAMGGEDESVPVALATPLQARGGRLIGYVYLLHKEGEGFTDNDRSLLTQLSQLMTARVENVRLYDRERRTAETLQRALLPQRLPRLPGVRLAARYLPGGDGAEVGGDWYDVIPSAGSRVTLAIGDVVGRGVPAASSMGYVRTGCRAYALMDLPPEVVVGYMQQLLSTLEEAHFSTLVYSVLDLETGRLRLVNAGHPPPLLIDAAGARYLKRARSAPLGVRDQEGLTADELLLERPSTLLLYTDGLLGRDAEGGLAALLEVAERPSEGLEELCDAVLEALVRPDLQDDVALLAVRLS